MITKKCTDCKKTFRTYNNGVNVKIRCRSCQREYYKESKKSSDRINRYKSDFNKIMNKDKDK